MSFESNEICKLFEKAMICMTFLRIVTDTHSSFHVLLVMHTDKNVISGLPPVAFQRAESMRDPKKSEVLQFVGN